MISREEDGEQESARGSTRANPLIEDLIPEPLCSLQSHDASRTPHHFRSSFYFSHIGIGIFIPYCPVIGSVGTGTLLR
jgi:hypothetical protein